MICCGDANLQEKMAASIELPYRIKPKGMHYYAIEKTLFEIDMKYVQIKLKGRGGYSVVCSSINKDTNDKVAITRTFIQNFIILLFLIVIFHFLNKINNCYCCILENGAIQCSFFFKNSNPLRKISNIIVVIQ